MQDKGHPKPVRPAIDLDFSKPLYLLVPESASYVRGLRRSGDRVLKASV